VNVHLNATTNSPNLLTLDEAASLVCRTRDGIRARVWRGQLHPYRFGRRLFVDRDELMSLFRRMSVR
jgi:hypothetical protein